MNQTRGNAAAYCMTVTGRAGYHQRSVRGKIMKKDMIAAHRYSSNHRESLLASDVCGCFYCLSIFSPSEIEDWVDARKGETDINESGQTALCPRCRIDSVLGSASGYPITRDFLQKMNDYWFQRTVPPNNGVHRIADKSGSR